MKNAKKIDNFSEWWSPDGPQRSPKPITSWARYFGMHCCGFAWHLFLLGPSRPRKEMFLNLCLRWWKLANIFRGILCGYVAFSLWTQFSIWHVYYWYCVSWNVLCAYYDTQCSIPVHQDTLCTTDTVYHEMYYVHIMIHSAVYQCIRIFCFVLGLCCIVTSCPQGQ